jgi:hypothetical protein
MLNTILLVGLQVSMDNICFNREPGDNQVQEFAEGLRWDKGRISSEIQTFRIGSSRGRGIHVWIGGQSAL